MRQNLHFRRSSLSILISICLATQSAKVLSQENEEAATSNLEVITVSAQKRTQNLQKVAVSITAFSGDEMAESAIKDIYDLQTSVPGMSAFQENNATTANFSIRGIGTSAQNFGLESSVGLYIDGVYRAKQSSMVNNLVDVEAVEVLRGPQGTLFGKNTPSGAILMRSVQPSHGGDDGFVELTAGNFNLLNYSGAVSLLAIEDVLAFRATAFGSKRDGIANDLNFGEGILNDKNRFGTRLQALYTPNENLSVRVIADYAEIDEVCCAAPVILNNVQATNVPGRFGTDALFSAPPFNVTPFIGGDAFFEREVMQTYLPKSKLKDRGLSAQMNWDLHNNYTVVSVSAYRKHNTFDSFDTDVSVLPFFGSTNDASQSSFSQELRLDYEGDKLNYILGTYYFTQDLDLDYKLTSEALFPTLFISSFQPGFNLGAEQIAQGIAAATGIPFETIQAVLPDAYGTFLGLAAGVNNVPFTSASELLQNIGLIATPPHTEFSHTAEQEHKSYAFFGQFDYQFTDTLTVTAGLRYSNEKKEMNTVFNEIGSGINGLDLANTPDVVGAITSTLLTQLGVPQTPEEIASAFSGFGTPGWGYLVLGSAGTLPREDIVASLSDDQITGTLKIGWQPNRQTFVYASYGTGYKSGGTNTDRIGAGFDPVFDAETSKAYEIGLKKDFVDHDFRINIAAHYTTVNDFQANTFNGIDFNLQNAGDLQTSGLELEATWVPLDTVEINFAYALVNAEYKTFDKGNCWVAFEWHNTPDGQVPADPGQESADPVNNPNGFCNRAGGRPAGEPENYAVFKIKKGFELADGIYSYLQADYSYTGDIALNGDNDPLSVQGSRSIFNLRLFMNIEDYDMDIIVWGRNLFSEEYVGGTNFNIPLQTGKLGGYVSEPATYGVTLKKRF